MRNCELWKLFISVCKRKLWKTLWIILSTSIHLDLVKVVMIVTKPWMFVLFLNFAKISTTGFLSLPAKWRLDCRRPSWSPWIEDASRIEQFRGRHAFQSRHKYPRSTNILEVNKHKKMGYLCEHCNDGDDDGENADNVDDKYWINQDYTLSS